MSRNNDNFYKNNQIESIHVGDHAQMNTDKMFKSNKIKKSCEMKIFVVVEIQKTNE